MSKFLQSLCRNNKAYIVISYRLLAKRDPNAVYSSNTEYVVLKLKLAAHKRRFTVDNSNCKLSLDNHTFEKLLRHSKAGVRVDLRNIGIVVGAGAADGERSHVVSDLSKVISAALESNAAGRHLSYNINSHLC